MKKNQWMTMSLVAVVSLVFVTGSAASSEEVSTIEVLDRKELTVADLKIDESRSFDAHDLDISCWEVAFHSMREYLEDKAKIVTFCHQATGSLYWETVSGKQECQLSVIELSNVLRFTLDTDEFVVARLEENFQLLVGRAVDSGENCSAATSLFRDALSKRVGHRGHFTDSAALFGGVLLPLHLPVEFFDEEIAEELPVHYSPRRRRYAFTGSFPAGFPSHLTQRLKLDSLEAVSEGFRVTLSNHKGKSAALILSRDFEVVAIEYPGTPSERTKK